MPSLVPPSPDIPVVRDDGRISEQWRAFFYELWRRSGGQLESVLVVGAGLTGEGTENQPLLLDFLHPANVDHEGVSIIAGTGLAGGGSIEQSRVLRIDFSELGIDANLPTAADFFVVQRGIELPRRIRVSTITGEADANLQAHIDSTAVHGATSAATAERLVLRDVNANAEFADPTSAQHAATKGYVDSERADHETTIVNHDDIAFVGLADDDFIQRKAGEWVNRTPVQVAGDLDHVNLQGIGTNSHPQIDTHIATGDIHVAHSGVVLTAGDGLIGGGDIAASRNFAVGAGAGISVSADAVSFDTVFGDARYALNVHTHVLVDITDSGLAAAAGVKNSIEIDAGDLQLVGDEAAPTADKYYGTDGVGALGFHALPTGGTVDAIDVTYDNVASGLVATNVQAAIDEVVVQIDTHATATNNPHAVTKAQVGLGNVDNVQQAAKTDFDTHVATETAPIHGSTAAATASKLVHRDAAGRAKIAAPSAADDIAQKAQADAVQTNLDSHTGDTGNPHAVTKAQVGLGSVLNVAQVENAGGNPSIESGLISARPAAGAVGSWFFATDENILYRDTGAVWEAVLSRDHADLDNIGTNSHAQIDSHIADGDIHVAHSGVVLSAGAGLTGGGNIAASRAFEVGAGIGITVGADDVAFDTVFGDARYALAGHLHDDRYYTETEVDAAFAAHETTIANHDDIVFATLADDDFIQRKAGGFVNRTPVQVAADLNHDLLAGFVADEHVAHGAVVLTAGAGLTGGGDISTSRSFDVGAGTGITVAADSVSFDTTFGDARYALDSHTHTLSDVTDSGAAAAAGVKNSVEIDLGDIQLVGDEAAPAADKYYGTDSLGALGFHDLPAGGGAVAAIDVTYDNTASGLTATNVQAAIDEVEAHIDRTDNPHAVTKAQVGLGNVDDVSAASLRDRATHTGTEPAAAFTTGPGVVPVGALVDAPATSVLARSGNSAGPPAYFAMTADDRLLGRVGGFLTQTVLQDGMVLPNTLAPSKLQDGAANSVLGRSFSTPGTRGDIVASADNTLLRRAGTSLDFGQLTLGMIPNLLITFGKLATGAIATQAEAEAGAAADKLMTPLRSRQHGDLRYPVFTEGTWTPVLQGSSSAGTYTYSAQSGRYRKVGSLVFIDFRLDISGVTTAGTGNTRIGGIPFSASDVSRAGGQMTSVANIAALPSNFATWSITVSTATQLELRFWSSTTGATGGVNIATAIQAGTLLRGFAFYIVL